MYVGSWNNDTRQGEGYYKAGETSRTWPPGSIYEGGWIDGKRCGSGKITYLNGDIYEGNFQNNKQHGFGQFRSIVVQSGGTPLFR